MTISISNNYTKYICNDVANASSTAVLYGLRIIERRGKLSNCTYTMRVPVDIQAYITDIVYV
jgi:hypothetical protein